MQVAGEVRQTSRLAHLIELFRSPAKKPLYFLHMQKLAHITRNSVAEILRRMPESSSQSVVDRSINKVAYVVNRLCLPGPQDSKRWTAMRLGYDMLVDLRSGTELCSYYTANYDNDAIRDVRRLLTPGATVFDIGANIGFWTVPLAQSVGKSGSIHAFEPVPANFSRLTENIKRNSLAGIVTLHPIGLSDQNGKVKISLREDFARGAETGNAAIVIDAEDSKFSSTYIEVARLDDIFDTLQASGVSFIKLDIEGHEDVFLAGAAETIRRFRPALYMEINESYFKRRGIDPTMVFENWMQGNSYKSFVHFGGRWHLDSIRKRRSGMDNVILVPSEASANTLKALR